MADDAEVSEVSWQEQRDGKLFWVIGEREGTGWRFVDKDSFEIRWYPAPATADRVRLAERFAQERSIKEKQRVPVVVDGKVLPDAQTGQWSSCVISYSTANIAFAKRLHADLRARQVPCWFAEEDFLAGDKLLDTLDSVIRLHDKLLIIMSAESIDSGWVEDEVLKAFAEERRRSEKTGRDVIVVIPIAIDDAFKGTTRPWAVKLKDSRYIQTFAPMADGSSYRRSFERLLKSLERRKPPPSPMN